MSMVRMCDNCGTVFSENAVGWSHMTQNITKTNEHGVKYDEHRVIDVCSNCVLGTTTPVPILPAIEVVKESGKNG